MAITMRFDSPDNVRRSTVYRSWGYSDRKAQAGVKISQEMIDKAKAEFKSEAKVITLEDIAKRGLLSLNGNGQQVRKGFKRGGWSGASPTDKGEV